MKGHGIIALLLSMCVLASGCANSGKTSGPDPGEKKGANESNHTMTLEQAFVFTWSEVSPRYLDGTGGGNCIRIESSNPDFQIMNGSFVATWTSYMPTTLEVHVVENGGPFRANSTPQASPLTYSFGALPKLQSNAQYLVFLELADNPGVLVLQKANIVISLSYLGAEPPKLQQVTCSG